MSAPAAAPPVAWAEPSLTTRVSRLGSRIGTFCLVEVQRLRHDRSELVTRAIQPILWLVDSVKNRFGGDAVTRKEIRTIDFAEMSAERSGRCSGDAEKG